MSDQDKTKQQLLEEVVELRQRVAVLEDVDLERRRAEEALREREERLLEAQEIANLGFAVIDLITGSIKTSTVLDRLCGIPADYERTLDRWADLVHPDERQEMLDYLKEVVGERKPFDREYRIVRYGDKQVRWFHGLGQLQFNEDGQPVSMLGILQDITERKQADRELAEHRAMLQATIDCLPFNFFAIGLDGRYILQNAVSKAHQGGDAIGKLPEEVCPSKHDLAIWADNNRRAFAGEKVEGEVTLWLGGEERFYYNIIAPIRGGEELLGILGVNIDITERKRAEEALRKANNELEEKVRERTAELSGANEHLRREVQERRLAEEALRQSERRFRNYFEQGLIGMAVTSMDKRWLEVNDRLCEILGYSREELLQTNWAALTHPDDLEPNIQLLNCLLAGEIEHFTLDKRFVRKDRGIVHATIHTRAFRKEDGTIDHIVTLVEDITARKQAEESLCNREYQLRNVLDTNPSLIFVKDRDSKILLGNEALARFYGTTLQQIVGTLHTDLHARLGMSPQEIAQWLADDRAAIDTGITQVFEERATWKDGSVHWYHTTKLQIALPGGQPGVLVVSEDITERKRVEESLRQSLGQLQTIYDGMVEGLLITDIETKRIRRVNCSFCRMLGYREEELLTKSIPDLHPPEEASNDLERFHTAAENRVSINEDRPVLRKDGSLFHADITGHPILYEGRPCLLALFRDVTGRRQAQAARERERRTLEHMLQASDRERRLIAYDIHDGLAQELAAAIMQFETFDHLKEAKPKQAHDAYHAAMTMLRQGHFEARRLISGVRPLILDEAGILTAIAHLVREPAFAKGPTVDFRSRVTFNRLAPVLEDVVYRIVQEGLTNARNHSKSPKILVSLLQRGDRLRVKIQDWGVGFDPKTVQENRFGLEGIRERARVLRGKCRIKSKPGEGTVVVVELPVVEQQVE